MRVVEAFNVFGCVHNSGLSVSLDELLDTFFLQAAEKTLPQKLIEFFESLIQEAGRKVFLILDNLGVHHGKPVKAWLVRHVDPIEVFYLPS